MYYILETAKGSYQSDDNQPLLEYVDKLAKHLAQCEMDTLELIGITKIVGDDEIPESPLMVQWHSTYIANSLNELRKEAKSELAHENAERWRVYA